MKLSKRAKPLVEAFVTQWETKLKEYQAKYRDYLTRYANSQQDRKKQLQELESAKKSSNKAQITSAEFEYNKFVRENRVYLEVDKAGNYSVVEQPYNVKQVQSALEIIRDFILSERSLVITGAYAVTNYNYYKQQLNQIDGGHRSWAPAIVEPELSYQFAISFRDLLQNLTQEENFVKLGIAETRFLKASGFSIKDTVVSMANNLQGSITFYEHVLLKDDQDRSAQEIFSSDSVPSELEIPIESKIKAKPYIKFNFAKEYNKPIEPDTEFQSVSTAGQEMIEAMAGDDLAHLDEVKDLISIEKNTELVRKVDRILGDYANNVQQYKPSKYIFKSDILKKLQETLTAYRYGIITTEENQAVFNQDFLNLKIVFKQAENNSAAVNSDVIKTLKRYTNYIKNLFASEITDNYLNFFEKQKKAWENEIKNEKNHPSQVYYSTKLSRLESGLMWHNQIITAAGEIERILNSENFQLVENRKSLIAAFENFNRTIYHKPPFENMLFEMVKTVQWHITEHNLACDRVKTNLGQTGDYLSVLKSELFNLLLELNINNDPESPVMIFDAVYQQAAKEKDITIALELARKYTASAQAQNANSDSEDDNDEDDDQYYDAESESDDEYYDTEDTEDTEILESNNTSYSSDNNINANNFTLNNQPLSSSASTLPSGNNNHSNNISGLANQIIEENENTKNNQDEYEFDFVKLQKEWQSKSRRLIEPRSTKTRKIDTLLDEINKGELKEDDKKSKDELNKGEFKKEDKKSKLEKIYQACKTWLYAEEKRKVIESSRIDNVLWLKSQAEYGLFIINNPEPEDKTQSAIYTVLKNLSAYIDSNNKLPRGLQAIKHLLDARLEKEETKNDLWKQYQLFNAIRKICSERLSRKGLTFFSAMSRSTETEKLYKALYLTELTQDNNQASTMEISTNNISTAYDLNRLNRELESLLAPSSTNQTLGFGNRN